MCVYICRHNIIKLRTKNVHGKIAFLDPMRTSRTFVDSCERDIEDQLINAMQSCNDGLVLWPFNQK